MSQINTSITELRDIKILVVDGHCFHRKGLISMLNGYKFIVKCDQADNGLIALELAKKNIYDVVIIETDVTKVSSFELVRFIKRYNQNCKIMIITADCCEIKICEFMDLGVSSYLFKKYSEKKIKNSIEKVMLGTKYISSEINEIYNDYKEKKGNQSLMNINEVKITNMEKQIITLMCEQLTSTQISSKLLISKSTVDTHRKRLFKKLNVVNLAGIIIYAVRTGLFNPWDIY